MRQIITLSILLGSVSVLGASDGSPFPAWDGKEAVPTYAERAKLPATLTLDLGDGVKWEGVLIPAGTFVMGSQPGQARTKEEEAEEKAHRVTLTRPFYIGKFELTQAQYEKVVGSNPSADKGPDLPVHGVACQDAETFCKKASQQSGKTVRLPTEAEWEFACRAGGSTLYGNGDTIESLEKMAWIGTNAGGKPHPVGQKEPNCWGVYDMHGNIREFCSDLYASEPQGDATDPTGPASGDPKNHVVKGAAYTANAAKALNVRSAARRPTELLKTTGFRIVVEAK